MLPEIVILISYGRVFVQLMLCQGVQVACPFSQSVSQAVDEKLTSAAIFLVVTLNPGTSAETTVRTFCVTLSSLVRGVGFRIPDGGLSCVLGFGEEGWRRLFGDAKPNICIPSVRSMASIMHLLRPEICYFISGQTVWISASN